MSKIRVLPEILANKIAAGEVVERPASVVKELLENSLDAGAKRIRIETDNGGKKFIKISDDGEGMTREDAMIAFERHATSKLRDIDELETIQTLGFRGEALPSIASVAKIFLRTKTVSDLEGTEIEIAGGRMLNIKDLAWPGGTEIEVQDLFFNMPARRKFLKSDSTEAFHITNLITHYALANPQISFTLLQNNRELIGTSPVETLRERAYQLFGTEFIENLVEINSTGEINIQGFVSKPQEQRATRDAQYLFVNGRFVRDRVLARAITDAYKNVIPPGTHPAVMLMIEVACEEVDVNVHPAKTEVRFRRPFIINEAVCAAIRNAFTQTKPFASFPTRATGATDATTESLQSTERNISWPQHQSSIGNQVAASSQDLMNLPPPPMMKLVDVDDPFGDHQSRQTDKTSDKSANYPLEQEAFPFAPDQQNRNNQPRQSIVGKSMLPQSSNETEALQFFDGATQTASPIAATAATTPATACAAQTINYLADEVVGRPSVGTIKPLGQLRDSYIVAVDDQGLMLIDQHVAHERVLFEYHLERILACELELQRLLIPETIDLTPAQLTAFEMIAIDLEASGFEMMRLSGRTIAIKSAPALLSAADTRILFLEMLSVVEHERRALSIEHFQREIAASVACHAAIKINTPLSEEKMQWLIDELLKTKSPTNCPHGRPIILRFSMREIERGFKRS